MKLWSANAEDKVLTLWDGHSLRVGSPPAPVCESLRLWTALQWSQGRDIVVFLASGHRLGNWRHKIRPCLCWWIACSRSLSGGWSANCHSSKTVPPEMVEWCMWLLQDLSIKSKRIWWSKSMTLKWGSCDHPRTSDSVRVPKKQGNEEVYNEFCQMCLPRPQLPSFCQMPSAMLRIDFRWQQWRPMIACKSNAPILLSALLNTDPTETHSDTCKIMQKHVAVLCKMFKWQNIDSATAHAPWQSLTGKANMIVELTVGRMEVRCGLRSQQPRSFPGCSGMI